MARECLARAAFVESVHVSIFGLPSVNLVTCSDLRARPSLMKRMGSGLSLEVFHISENAPEACQRHFVVLAGDILNRPCPGVAQSGPPILFTPKWLGHKSSLFPRSQSIVPPPGQVGRTSGISSRAVAGPAKTAIKAAPNIEPMRNNLLRRPAGNLTQDQKAVEKK